MFIIQTTVHSSPNHSGSQTFISYWGGNYEMFFFSALLSPRWNYMYIPSACMLQQLRLWWQNIFYFCSKRWQIPTQPIAFTLNCNISFLSSLDLNKRPKDLAILDWPKQVRKRRTNQRSVERGQLKKWKNKDNFFIWTEK